MGLSPEQIAGRLMREQGRTLISHESIYRFTYHRSAQKDYWHRLLPRARHSRGRFARQGGSMVNLIKHRRPLSERMVEAQDRKAERTARHLADMLDALASPMRRTIAFDNGPEFALHHQLTGQTGIQTFFCDVRSPWHKAASKTLSDACAAPCRAKPISKPAARPSSALPHIATTTPWALGAST